MASSSFTLKYQLPLEDLHSLISVTTDEDLENLIEEYERLNSSSACVEMENNIHQNRGPPIEELSKRIQDLADAHALLKQKMLEKFMISGDPKNSNSRSSRRGTQHPAPNLTEADYFNILQSIDQPIHITNSKGCIIYKNQAWENFYGYTGAEVLGKVLHELVIEPRDIPIANDILQEMLIKGECWTGEFPVRNKRGERFVVIGSTKPFRDENGTIIGFICITAAPRPYKELRLSAPTRVASENLESDHNKHPRSGRTSACSSMVNEIRRRLGSKAGGCFDSTTSRFFWHWLHCDQEHEYGQRMGFSASMILENQPSVGNTNCAGHDNKALRPSFLFNYNVDCEIKWEDLMIRERIGRVWQGSDVALKLFSQREHSHDLMVSFMHEVSLMKRMRHPNILLFMGTVISPQRICIVTEFLRRARLDWRRRIRMAIDIARGISYLYRCVPPIIHRDLNSLNLLVDKDWTVKVGDFGLCRTKHETYVTRNEGIGKPEWTAPEALRNEQADERSDIYSYGVVLWEITTEKIPWDGLNSMQVMEAVGVMNRRLDIPKDVDPRWASLIQRCLCSEPQSRPTFQEILEELHDLHMRFKFTVPLQEGSRRARNCNCETDA